MRSDEAAHQLATRVCRLQQRVDAAVVRRRRRVRRVAPGHDDGHKLVHVAHVLERGVCLKR